MKYILNTGRYAIAFTIVKNGRDLKISLDKRRLYMDTGNVATTGLTPVEEADIEELKKQSRFNKMIEAGELTILDEKDVKSPEEDKISKLEEENKKLKEQLAEAENEDGKPSKEVEKAMKVLEDENASLKAQLEALTKDKVDTATEDKATDGF